MDDNAGQDQKEVDSPFSISKTNDDDRVVVPPVQPSTSNHHYHASQKEWDALQPRANEIFQAARQAQYAHHAAVQQLERWHQLLGIAATILAALSGASILSRIADYPGETSHKLLIETLQGVVALAASAFSGLQTRLNFSKTAETHLRAADGYGDFRRRLKTTFKMPLRMREDLRSYFNEVEAELRDLATKSPAVPDRVWQATERRLKKDPSPLMEQA